MLWFRWLSPPLKQPASPSSAPPIMISATSCPRFAHQRSHTFKAFYAASRSYTRPQIVRNLRKSSIVEPDIEPEPSENVSFRVLRLCLTLILKTRTLFYLFWKPVHLCGIVNPILPPSVPQLQLRNLRAHGTRPHHPWQYNLSRLK